MSDRRTELGFERTVCDCRACKINCEFIPGFLLPSDIRRIALHLGYSSVSPYGCSHFDAHQTNEEADLRSSAGHYQVDLAWKNDHLYARLWLLLNALGRVAPSPVATRARMRVAIKAQDSSSFPRVKNNDRDHDE